MRSSPAAAPSTSRPSENQCTGIARRPAVSDPGRRIRKFVVECKILHKSLDRTVSEGLQQTAAYMDRCGAEAGHLVIFDRGPGRWEDKLFHRRPSPGNTDGDAEVHVWGM